MKVSKVHCKKCGNALGTGVLVCPFCGATLTKEQLKVKEAERKRMFGNPELLTAKYGEKIVYQQTQKDNKFLVYLLVFSVIVLIVFVILLITSIF